MTTSQRGERQGVKRVAVIRLPLRAADLDYDYTRVNGFPDRDQIRRECQRAQAMHDEAMNGNQDGD